MSELLAFILEHPQFRKNRLPSLYSDFRHLHTTNLSGYSANLTAWKSALSSYLLSSSSSPSKLILATSSSLASDLQTRDFGRPLALSAVITDALRKREWIALGTFLTQRESVYHWTYLGAAMGWALELTGLKSSAPARGAQVPNGRWVVVANVEVVAKDVLEKARSGGADAAGRAGSVFTLEHFLREFGMNEEDARVLVTYLSRDAKEAAWDPRSNVVKLFDTSPVTEQDVSVAQLRALLATLNARIDKLAADVKACTAKSAAAVAAKNRPLALAALRSRKTAESALETQLKSLHQVEEVMAAIQTAEGNVELVRQMENSSKVLKELNKAVGGTERVDRVMDELRDEVDNVKEVNQILGEATGEEVVDEVEVEEELEKMLREEEEKAKVPPPPTERPVEAGESLAETMKQLELSGAPAHEPALGDEEGKMEPVPAS